MTETILCECGMIVNGLSKEHAEYNLKAHKRGRRHKSMMDYKKEHLDQEKEVKKDDY